jgi:Na+-translocating ferredoxin:NAD+ oxidoreductase subunit C
VVSTATGVIQSITSHLGDYGRKYTAIAIKTDESGMNGMRQFNEASKQIDRQTLIDFLTGAPGAPDLDKLANAKKPIHTIVVYGGDTDLLVDTNLYVLKSRTNAVNRAFTR